MARLSLPIRWFPLWRHAMVSPIHGTRLPLSPHCNPFSAHGIRQPRCFPPQSVHFFSLFCRSGFKEQRAACCSGRRLSGLTSHPPHPRKAGYVCTQRYGQQADAPHCRFTICFVHRPKYHAGVRLCIRTGLHGNRVGLTMPLLIALSPQARKNRASPQHPPKKP